jgi:hypothetical protein
MSAAVVRCFHPMKRLSVSELREADLYTYAGRVSVPSGSECWQAISAQVGFGIFPILRLPARLTLQHQDQAKPYMQIGMIPWLASPVGLHKKGA